MSEKVKNRLEFIINIAFIAVVCVLVYLAYKYVLGWVLPFILAFLLVSIMNPIVRFVNSKIKIKQEIASLIFMIFLYFLVGTLIFAGVSRLAFFIKNNFAFLPDYFETSVIPTLNSMYNSLKIFIGGLPEEWQLLLEELQGGMVNAIQNFVVNFSQKGVSMVSTLTNRIPTFFIGTIFTIMLSFFISLQYDKVKEFLKKQLPDRANKFLLEFKIVFKDTVLKYIKAYIKLMFITFVELAIGLTIIGVNMSIPLAALIAIFDALPILGTGGIMIPWIIIEAIQGNFSLALGLLIIYVIITVIRNIIEPKIIGDQLGLNPIVSLTSIYLGFRVMGVIGMIVMPIIMQIIIALHKNGSITIFQEMKNR